MTSMRTSSARSPSPSSPAEALVPLNNCEQRFLERVRGPRPLHVIKGVSFERLEEDEADGLKG